MMPSAVGDASLIQWAWLLKQSGFDPAVLDHPKLPTDEVRRLLLRSYSVLAKTREDLTALRKRAR